MDHRYEIRTPNSPKEACHQSWNSEEYSYAQKIVQLAPFSVRIQYTIMYCENWRIGSNSYEGGPNFQSLGRHDNAIIPTAIWYIPNVKSARKAIILSIRFVPEWSLPMVAKEIMKADRLQMKVP